MNLRYSIDSEEYSISFSRQIDNRIVNLIEKLNSDKNILIVIDDKIDSAIIKHLKIILKIRGFNNYYLNVSGSKKIRT